MVVNYLNPAAIGLAWINAKEIQEGKKSEKNEEKERDRGTEGETPTPSRTTVALIGDEEQNGKQERKKERNKERAPNPATLDHTVATYDA